MSTDGMKIDKIDASNFEKAAIILLVILGFLSVLALILVRAIG